MSGRSRGLDIVVHADVSVPYLDDDVRDSVSGLLGGEWSPGTFRLGTVLATASVRGEVVGCALARRSPGPAPDRASPGLRALGPDRYVEWLAGGLELTGVAMDAGHRRRGIGAAVTEAALTPARGQRGWAQLTGGAVARSGEWLTGRGFRAVAADRDGTGTVLLAPAHPALRDGENAR